MSDFEARLRGTVETIADDAPRGDDLLAVIEDRVGAEQRKRRFTKATGAGLAVAALVAGAVVAVSALHNAPAKKRVEVSTPTSVTPTPSGAVPSGTVLLSARGPDVVALDAGGRDLSTLATVGAGHKVLRAQLAADGALWYLTIPDTANFHGCGEVVRLDMKTNESKVETHATDFSLSPNGARLALIRDIGAFGDPTGCIPKAVANDAFWVRDVPSGVEQPLVPIDLTNVPISTTKSVGHPSWKPGESDRYAVTACTGTGCLVFRVDVPARLSDATMSVESTVPTSPQGQSVIIDTGVTDVAWSAAGMYVVRGDHLAAIDSVTGVTELTMGVDVFDAQLTKTSSIFEAKNQYYIERVIPTSSAVYVVAQKLTPSTDAGPTYFGPDHQDRLYRVDGTTHGLVPVGLGSDLGIIDAA